MISRLLNTLFDLGATDISEMCKFRRSYQICYPFEGLGGYVPNVVYACACLATCRMQEPDVQQGVQLALNCTPLVEQLSRINDLSESHQTPQRLVSCWPLDHRTTIIQCLNQIGQDVCLCIV